MWCSEIYSKFDHSTFNKIVTTLDFVSVFAELSWLITFNYVIQNLLSIKQNFKIDFNIFPKLTMKSEEQSVTGVEVLLDCFYYQEEQDQKYIAEYLTQSLDIITNIVTTLIVVMFQL